MNIQKRWICVALTVCLVLLFGCRTKTEGSPLLREGAVESVYVTTLPEGWYEFDCDAQQSARVVEYLENLTLIEDFDENPSDYYGMTWVITLRYTDGTEHMVYHSGNMFVRSADSDWYRMVYEEAELLETILKEE